MCYDVLEEIKAEESSKEYYFPKCYESALDFYDTRFKQQKN